jgi:hypothetical protein
MSVFFIGTVNFELADRIWKMWTSPKCMFFLWLAALNHCWTANRLARWGLEHPEKCPLCDQEDETVQHLLVSCVFAREVWAQILSKVGLQHLSPSSDEKSFQDWWRSSEIWVDAAVKKSFNSLVVCLKVPPQVPLEFCRTSRMRRGSGALQELPGWGPSGLSWIAVSG